MESFQNLIRLSSQSFFRWLLKEGLVALILLTLSQWSSSQLKYFQNVVKLFLFEMEYVSPVPMFNANMTGESWAPIFTTFQLPLRGFWRCSQQSWISGRLFVQKVNGIILEGSGSEWVYPSLVPQFYLQ